MYLKNGLYFIMQKYCVYGLNIFNNNFKKRWHVLIRRKFDTTTAYCIILIFSCLNLRNYIHFQGNPYLTIRSDSFYTYQKLM